MKITLKGKDNVYEQIVNEYKRFISLGIIKFDEKLPSCRQLASDLGINPNTVQWAYNVLEQDGYIKVLPKKGVYVCYQINNDFNKETNEIKLFIEKMKKENVSYNEFKNILDEVYGGEVKWFK